MVLIIVFIFFGAVFIFDFLSNIKNRSKKETVFYIAVFIISFTIILLKSLDLWSYDPVKTFMEFVQGAK